MRGQRIAKNEINGVLASLIGLPISRVWRGYGSAVFFELGALRPYKNRKGTDSPQGDVSLMIEWSWRVEKARSIWFGAFSSQKTIDSRLPQLVGRTVIAASFAGRLPEISLELSDGLWFSSFMCAQGQQEWVIFDSSFVYYAKAKNFYKEPINEAYQAPQTTTKSVTADI
jgi:hypothetical protein